MYTGRVTHKQCSGGFSGDLVYMCWNAPDDGGPPLDMVPHERPERRFWWDGDGCAREETETEL